MLLVGVDVLLELARQKLAHLGIQAVDIGDQRKQRQQHQQRMDNGRFMLGVLRGREVRVFSLRLLPLS